MGRGLAKWLIECILTHPDLQNLRRWILVTEDAHGLYRKQGFTQLAHPEGFMELHDPDVYNAEKRRRNQRSICKFKAAAKLGYSLLLRSIEDKL
jgi:hypothetical protein